MVQSNTNRLFFAKNLTFRQLLTWRPILGMVLGGTLILGLFFIPQILAQTEEGDEKLGPLIVNVKTQLLQSQSEYSIPIRYTGQVSARRKTDVAFQRSGKVTQILFDEGDFVDEKQPIATLDSRQLQARIKQLGAEMLAATARRDELKKGPRIQAIRTAQANVTDFEQQLENAKLDLQRAERLLPQGALSQQEFDQAKYRVSTLEARIDASRAQLEELKVGTRIEQVDAAAAALSAAQAANELAEHDLDDCTLRAPFSGTLTRRMVDEGAVLDTGQPVFELVESQHLEFKVGLPVELTRSLSVGDQLWVDIDGVSIKSQLRSKLLTLDANTQTQTVVLALASSASEQGVVDGQMGRVKFEKPMSEKGFLIPISAIVNDQNGLWNCYTIESKKGISVARRQAIEVLHFQGDFVFVRGTISDGQSIAVSGLHNLTNGQAVRVVAATEEVE